MGEPPELPGVPGRLAKFAHKIRQATQIFPPPGVGIGVGIGLGCGVGWSLRRAYGPPQALCKPAIGVGLGIGYGQGFGRRFGRDRRNKSFVENLQALERWLDAAVNRLWTQLRKGFTYQEPKPLSFLLHQSPSQPLKSEPLSLSSSSLSSSSSSSSSSVLCAFAALMVTARQHQKRDN